MTISLIENPQDFIRVTDIKEYTFCPRIYYYEACLPGLHHHTVKTLAGQEAHERERALANRRTLAAFGLTEGESYFDVPVHSEAYQVIGEIDQVIICLDEAIPVDFKNTTRLGYQFKLQLTAYGLLLAESQRQTVRRGFFYLIPEHRAEELIFTAKLQRSAAKALETMREIVIAERVPPPTRYQDRCLTCKYRRFCNDV
ncbi:MAG: CRISPR-associated protein Cas4 [Anaerolineae bacterium]|nr:CRISPR-associated protein Cas4 [Anaerolineae bacterium]